MCAAKQCAVSQSVFTDDKEFACWASFAVSWSKACATSKPLFSVQSLAGARKFARVVAIWLLDFDLDGCAEAKQVAIPLADSWTLKLFLSNLITWFPVMSWLMIPWQLGVQQNAAMYSNAHVCMQTFDCCCTMRYDWPLYEFWRAIGCLLSRPWNGWAFDGVVYDFVLCLTSREAGSFWR